MIKDNLRVAIISIYSFPHGGAATNRILAYAKGMVENGAEVDIFNILPTENFIDSKRISDEGVFQGINYYYTGGRYRNKYKILRGLAIKTRFRQFYGYFTSYRLISKRNNSNQYSHIIISTDLFPALKIYSNLARKINAKSIFIFDEFPIPIRHKLKKRIPTWKQLLYRKVLINIDAYISISEELKKYYCRFSMKPTHVLPVIVDYERFSNKDALFQANRKYLCYMGNMELSKDDVDNIIKAYHLIANRYQDIDLYLYGKPSKSVKKYLVDLVNDMDLNTRVFLKGRVGSEDVPAILNNAFILVSSQPDTVRASGGFPTKLGEYLSTGIPSILTDVGENAKYVKDGEHVFLVKPHNPQEYANRLDWIITNYEKALLVAKEGQSYVYNNYSHTIQGKALLGFLATI